MKGMDQRRQDKKSFKEESKWARKQVAAWKARGKWVGAKQTLLEYSFKVASCNVHPTTPIPCLPPDLSPSPSVCLALVLFLSFSLYMYTGLHTVSIHMLSFSISLPLHIGTASVLRVVVSRHFGVQNGRVETCNPCLQQNGTKVGERMGFGSWCCHEKCTRYYEVYTCACWSLLTRPPAVN